MVLMEWSTLHVVDVNDNGCIGCLGAWVLGLAAAIESCDQSLRHWILHRHLDSNRTDSD